MLDRASTAECIGPPTIGANLSTKCPVRHCAQIGTAHAAAPGLASLLHPMQQRPSAGPALRNLHGTIDPSPCPVSPEQARRHHQRYANQQRCPRQHRQGGDADGRQQGDGSCVASPPQQRRIPGQHPLDRWPRKGANIASVSPSARRSEPAGCPHGHERT